MFVIESKDQAAISVFGVWPAGSRDGAERNPGIPDCARLHPGYVAVSIAKFFVD